MPGLISRTTIVRTLCRIVLLSFALLLAQPPAQESVASPRANDSQSQRRSSSRSTRKENRVAALSKEAEAEANKHWNVIITKCGDSYYMTEARFIYQLKGVSFKVIASAPSPADELNGIGGRANAGVHSKLGRRYDTEFHQWGAWIERLLPSGSGYWLVKKNGVWQALLPNQVSAIACSKIPS
jgi:hypothetical protein